jgi:hypothetical protein
MFADSVLTPSIKGPFQSIAGEGEVERKGGMGVVEARRQEEVGAAGDK